MKTKLNPVQDLGEWLAPAALQRLQQAVRDAVAERAALFDPPQLASACGALWAASQGDDIDYDAHPAIGPAYASWYHLQRTNTAVHAVLTCFQARRGVGPLVIYDLGSGTGAVSWAVGLALCWMEARGLPVPAVTLVSVERCAALSVQAEVLWREMGRHFPGVSRIRRELQPVPWQQTQPGPAAAEEAWIVASYLFDHGDRNRIYTLGPAFRDVVNRVGAAQVAIVGSQAKSGTAQAVLQAARLACGTVADYRLPVTDDRRIRLVQALRDGWRAAAEARNAPGADRIAGPVLWVPKEGYLPHCLHGTPGRPTYLPGSVIRVARPAAGGPGVVCTSCRCRHAKYAHEDRAYCKVCYLACPDAPLAALGVVQHGTCRSCCTETQLLTSLAYAYCRTCFPVKTGLTSGLPA